MEGDCYCCWKEIAIIVGWRIMSWKESVITVGRRVLLVLAGECFCCWKESTIIVRRRVLLVLEGECYCCWMEKVIIFMKKNAIIAGRRSLLSFEGVLFVRKKKPRKSLLILFPLPSPGLHRQLVIYPNQKFLSFHSFKIV